MKKLIILTTSILAVMASGCRSDADQMAEFCLNFDAEVQAASDCADMSSRIDKLLSGPQPRLHDESICEKTTACLPCRNAAQKLLGDCGYEENMRPVLDKFHFSKMLSQTDE